MEFICTRENLERGLSIVSKSVDQKASLPILSTILFETQNGRLKLSSTNLEMGITCYLGGHVKSEGKCAVPVKILNEYVSNLPEGKVSFNTHEDRINLVAGDFNAEIKGMAADEFPLIPKINGEPLCVLNGEEFKKNIVKTIFSAAFDDSRPEISGLFMSFSNNEVKLVTTDGYRLSEGTIKPLHFSGKEDEKLILPSKTAHEASRILTENNEKVALYPDNGQVRISFKDATVLQSEIEIVSKLIEGNYPSYQEIIPENFTVKAFFSREEFLQALKAVSLFAKKETNEVNISLEAESKGIVLSAESLTVGKNSAKISGEIEGDSLKIAFNYRYLMEGLSAIDSDKLEFFFSGGDGPALLKPKEEKYRHVIMPLETQ